MKSNRSPRAGLIAATLLLGASVSPAQYGQLLVTNVEVVPRPFTGRVDVLYDLETVDFHWVTVNLFLSTDSGATYPYRCQSVSGDVGAGVYWGSGRRILWNARADCPGFSSTTCRLMVTADDAPNLDDFVYVPPGAFTMGSPQGEVPYYTEETQHQVTLTHGIYVQATEVTNQQYMEMAQWAYDQGFVTVSSTSLSDNLDGSTEELLDLDHGACEVDFSGGVFTCVNPDHPVQLVTWYGSVAYCDWLSLQQQLPRAYNHGTWECNGDNPYTAVGYRLPTEAEWEYACRAGSTTAFANGPIIYFWVCNPVDPNLDEMGWYCGNAGGGTHPVALKRPNSWGLYDMHGNALEWCNDWFAPYGGAVTDPAGPDTGSHRVFRNGSWHDPTDFCRSAFRGSAQPDDSGPAAFRPVRSADVTSYGMITIDPDPNSINAAWQITGPNGFSYSGTGDTTLVNMTIGVYTLTWGSVPGWMTPIPATIAQPLIQDEIWFNGVYIVDPEIPDGFVSVPAGTFTMGSPWGEPGRDIGETSHQVTLTHGLYVQATEVTNQQYVEIVQWAYDHGYVTATGLILQDNLDGSTETIYDFSYGPDITLSYDGVFGCVNPDWPVRFLNWYGSVAYCDWLSLQQGLPRAYDHGTWECNGGNPYTATGYRLPTEAEWEYACRAGSTTAFANGPITYPYDCSPLDPYLDLMGWYCGNAAWTLDVAQKLSNVWGLYDMHGSLAEWCNDWYGPYGGDVTDPVGGGADVFRVMRGGGYENLALYCRSANRMWGEPSNVFSGVGVRPVRSAD